MKHLYILFILYLLFVPFVIRAQNLEEIGLKKGAKLSGSVNLNAVGYAAKGIEARRDPFNWFLSGNLNVNLFGYNAPLSFSYSNAGGNFTQPFNQFSFAPQYKWVKTYIGYSSMTFSPYTLAGYTFLGGGVEVTPDKWKIAAMYGRLKKAVSYNLQDSTQYTEASYKRMGYGFKVGYDNNGNTVTVSLFQAKDDISSLPFVLPESQITPQQNIAVSLGGHVKVTSALFIEGEYGLSALNTDIRKNKESIDTIAIANHNLIQGLLPQNSTQRYYDAFNGSVGYQGSWYKLQVKYERIAPEYTTLGAYYFNNDMRNITIVPAVQLFQNKLTLSANVGLQQNNLDKTRNATTKRVVGALNATYAPNENWNFAGNYSNFSSYSNMRPQLDPYYKNTLDTLNYYQVTQTSSGTATYSFGDKNQRQSIMLMGSYQRANTHAGYAEGNDLSDFYTGNVAYSYSLAPKSLTLATAFNYYLSNASTVNSLYWGPTLSVTKGLLAKTLRSSLASSFNKTTANGASSGPVWNNRLSLSYSPKKAGGEKQAGRHNAMLGINRMQKFAGTDTGTSNTTASKKYTEWTINSSYTYSF
ncbi:hypothetical protein QNI19_34655 [Cytophagaceae bacterium DM2B3-1]|uniref:Outer membrane protein beta-barrel domain-containing protein n=1 Tax=Xanthocytophaga flava TaxID=3048013 RepID=A0ABT7CWJ4_9BACT|nr:hypothetical protein [Xanthocytophaga flavus]MDJ1498135.1 hypothetical protein [Xanthocytophaga flavus]